jgi:hypothetical protein
MAAARRKPSARGEARFPDRGSPQARAGSEPPYALPAHARALLARLPDYRKPLQADHARASPQACLSKPPLAPAGYPRIPGSAVRSARI